MSRTEFIKLAEAYMKEIKADREITEALGHYGIIWEREVSPLLLYAEHELSDALGDDEVDVPALLGEIADYVEIKVYEGEPCIGEQEIFSAEALWDFFKG